MIIHFSALRSAWSLGYELLKKWNNQLMLYFPAETETLLLTNYFSHSVTCYPSFSPLQFPNSFLPSLRPHWDQGGVWLIRIVLSTRLCVEILRYWGLHRFKSFTRHCWTSRILDRPSASLVLIHTASFICSKLFKHTYLNMCSFYSARFLRGNGVSVGLMVKPDTVALCVSVCFSQH